MPARTRPTSKRGSYQRTLRLARRLLAWLDIVTRDRYEAQQAIEIAKLLDEARAIQRANDTMAKAARRRAVRRSHRKSKVRA
jgi:hypothetical protein